MLLPPHVQRGMGMLILGTPSTRKPYHMALMAVRFTSDIETILGGVRQTPVLYVDLERNQLEFQRPDDLFKGEPSPRLGIPFFVQSIIESLDWVSGLRSLLVLKWACDTFKA